MKNWKFAALAGAIFVVSILLVLQAKEVGASLVLEPSELLDPKTNEQYANRRIQVVGTIAEEDLSFETEPRLKLMFRVSEASKPSVSIPVKYYGLKPDMFAPGRQVIISGMMNEETLIASTLQTQCPSKYEAPDAETIAARYKSEVQDSGLGEIR